MPNDYFSTFLKRASRPELIHAARDARQWISGVANQLDKVQGKVLADRPRDLSTGSMYLFIYDAKLKDTLKYWDMHPVIFPIGVSGDRFMGLNFHYLPIGARLKLLDALYDFADNQADPDKSLAISYRILKGISKYRLFKPTIHVYLNNHVRSKFIWIPSTEWKKTLLLPLQTFQGKHPNAVYADSMSRI